MEELLNGAVGPAMHKLSSSSEDLRKGIALLALAAHWLSRMSAAAKAKVVRGRILVPVIKRDGLEEIGWIWGPSTTAYFGIGWLDQKHETLLHEAYGERDATITIGWNDFLGSAPDNFRDQSGWVEALEAMGVSKSPTLLKRPAQGRRAPFKAYENERLHVRFAVPDQSRQAVVGSLSRGM
jgi:hypothetical protein